MRNQRDQKCVDNTCGVKCFQVLCFRFLFLHPPFPPCSLSPKNLLSLHIISTTILCFHFPMLSSDETAYSPNTNPKTRDWAKINHDDRGQYGTGPGLKDPN